MNDLKRLFKRDKIFLLCLAGITGLIVLFGLFRFHEYLEESWKINNKMAAYFDNPEFLKNIPDLSTMDYGYLQILFIAVLGAQFVKWIRLEGKGGREFQNLLPVKSSSFVNFDLICGILYLWIPVILSGLFMTLLLSQSRFEFISEDYLCLWKELFREMIVFFFYYSLLIFAKKITNHMYGMVFGTFVIIYTLLNVIWFILDKGSNFLMWTLYGGQGKMECAVLLLLIVIFILLAYWCNKKRDLAAGGTFSFKTVHYLMVIAVFADLAATFYVMEMFKSQMLRVLVSILLAGAISAGVHYLARAKSI